jgi:hypothetical protein
MKKHRKTTDDSDSPQPATAERVDEWSKEFLAVLGAWDEEIERPEWLLPASPHEDRTRVPSKRNTASNQEPATSNRRDRK